VTFEQLQELENDKKCYSGVRVASNVPYVHCILVKWRQHCLRKWRPAGSIGRFLQNKNILSFLNKRNYINVQFTNQYTWQTQTNMHKYNRQYFRANKKEFWSTKYFVCNL